MNTKDDGKQLDLKMILKRFKELGGLSNAEKVSGFVIVLTGFLWIFKTKINSFFGINFSDSGIAITCAFLFFIIPCDKKYNVLLGSGIGSKKYLGIFLYYLEVVYQWLL